MPLLQIFKTKQTWLLITIAILVCASAPIGVRAYRTWRLKQEAARLAQAEAEYKKLEQSMLAQMTDDQLRKALATKYKSLIQEANPSLNGIQVYYDEWAPDKSRFKLYAHHPNFSKFSFSSGPLAKQVEQWESEHRAELRRAGVVRIGVRSEMNEMGALVEVQ